MATERRYHARDCAVFRATRDEFGALSNFATAFPFDVAGVPVLTTEALFQALKFPRAPEAQKRVLEARTPAAAKTVAWQYPESQVRRDWEQVRVQTMRDCLLLKVMNYPEHFQKLLQRTGDRPIVELSASDRYWGAMPNRGGELVGINALGRLWMQVRQDLRTGHLTDEVYRAAHGRVEACMQSPKLPRMGAIPEPERNRVPDRERTPDHELTR